MSHNNDKTSHSYVRLPKGRGEAKDTKIYIGNLDPRVTEKHIIDLFSKVGPVKNLDFLWHHHGVKKGQPKGFCFIEYVRKEDADTAVQKLQGKLLAGRKLNVKKTTQYADKLDKDGGYNKRKEEQLKPTSSVVLSRDAYQGIRNIDESDTTASKIALIEQKLKAMKKGSNYYNNNNNRSGNSSNSNSGGGISSRGISNTSKCNVGKKGPVGKTIQKK